MESIQEITDDPINPEPREIEAGVYVGCATTKAGEPIYLRMELITEENRLYWEQYKKQTHLMAAGDSRSILGYLAMQSKKIIEGDGSIHYVYDEPPSAYFGFTQEELNEFIGYLGNQGYIGRGHNGGVRTQKTVALLANSVGSDHIHLSATGQRYIIYASKTPDFSILSTKPYVYGDNLTLKKYMVQYSNLLMCVGSDFSKDQYFENRGIFRNPISMIENTYKGISMVLHGFSGAVAKKYFPEKKEMHVKPVGSMQLIICQSLNTEDITIVGSTVQEVLSNMTMDGPQDKYTHIKVDALAGYYKSFGPSYMEHVERLHVSTEAGSIQEQRVDSTVAVTQQAKIRVSEIRHLGQASDLSSAFTPKLGGASDESS